MHRRLLITALGCWPALQALAQDDAGRPHQKISTEALERALMTRFPVRFGVPGLLAAQLDAARLLLFPARQRLGATVVARVREAASRRVQAAELDLVFAVRYEAADQTLRAHDLEIAGLRSDDLPAEALPTWQALLGNAARSAVSEVVLHRLSARELAVPDLIGMQPERITVEDDGVTLWFGPKPRG